MNYKNIGDILSKTMIVYIPLSLLTPLLMYQMRDNNRMIVMDNSNTYHITEYTPAEKLKEVYEYNIRLATTVFLMRNPAGFDNAELFSQVFAGNGKVEALKQLKSEEEQFKKYGMHQKAEILNVRIIRADKRRAFANVDGQLIRFYIENDEKKTFTVKFELNIELTTNFDSRMNGRYPFLVTEMKYNQNKVEEDK